jgi:serine/threonine protein kinase
MVSGSIDTMATMSSSSIDNMATMSSGSADNMATMSSAAGTRDRVAVIPALEPETVWGPYRIGRLLGRGGMGEVYEAEHLTSGRRVALKILHNRLQTQDERARFLREGQLAASVSHPHTVYIFGSEEIDGTPVISMELLSGGTLKDRVTSGGPMRPDEAVAAVLDLIGGLDAAASAGILHRDIKPSNCFIDSDGVVKVGDFGLSISTLARDVHQQLVTSGFEGTPQFAPPEQLRGEPLDVRADIYAVGATLYYLLTGKAPFDAPDLRQLFAKVTTETAVPPRQLRREIPARLSAVVMQCLAKAPADRPPSYPALAEALRPFLARNDTPAPLATRFMASVLDSWLIVGLPVAVLTALLANPLSNSPDRMAAITNMSWLVALLYYLILEGSGGASLAKRLLGLRVVSADGTAVSWSQIALRTVVFYLPNMIGAVLLFGGLVPETWPPPGSESGGVRMKWNIDVVRTTPVALSALMFFWTARRRNGWMGLHDKLSGTRVVARPPVVEHARSSPQNEVTAVPSGSARRYGPFVAIDDGDARPGQVVRAFDPVLRRPVWIEIGAASMPPISDVRRDLARPGRLHWLAGRRSQDENWDAYEAPDGAAWTSTVGSGAWSQTKLQLLDLANELSSSADDGTQPPLALDRVWTRDNGRTVLLDFAPPGSAARAPATLTPEQLLQSAASRVPRDPAQPASLPLSARVFLDQWSSSGTTLAQARAALQAMAPAANRVQWWRRALPGALAGSPVVVMLLVLLAIVPALAQFTSSDTIRMMNLLGALKSTSPAADNPMRDPEVREAAEIAIAGNFGARIRDDEFWNSGIVRELAKDYRAFAEDIVRRRPDVTAQQVADAEAVLKNAREERDRANRTAGRQPQQSALELTALIVPILTGGAMALVLLACMLSALIVPGGLVSRQLGLAAVTRSGREVSRLRSLARVLVAGLPAIAWLIYLVMSPKVRGFVPVPPNPVLSTLIPLVVLAIGLLWTIVRRTRGPHDLVVGTWVVPR